MNDDDNQQWEAYNEVVRENMEAIEYQNEQDNEDRY